MVQRENGATWTVVDPWATPAALTSDEPPGTTNPMSTTIPLGPKNSVAAVAPMVPGAQGGRAAVAVIKTKRGLLDSGVFYSRYGFLLLASAQPLMALRGNTSAWLVAVNLAVSLFLFGVLCLVVKDQFARGDGRITEADRAAIRKADRQRIESRLIGADASELGAKLAVLCFVAQETHPLSQAAGRFASEEWFERLGPSAPRVICFDLEPRYPEPTGDAADSVDLTTRANTRRSMFVLTLFFSTLIAFAVAGSVAEWSGLAEQWILAAAVTAGVLGAAGCAYGRRLLGWLGILVSRVEPGRIRRQLGWIQGDFEIEQSVLLLQRRRFVDLVDVFAADRLGTVQLLTGVRADDPLLGRIVRCWTARPVRAPSAPSATSPSAATPPAIPSAALPGLGRP